MRGRGVEYTGRQAHWPRPQDAAGVSHSRGTRPDRGHCLGGGLVCFQLQVVVHAEQYTGVSMISPANLPKYHCILFFILKDKLENDHGLFDSTTKNTYQSLVL